MEEHVNSFIYYGNCLLLLSSHACRCEVVASRGATSGRRGAGWLDVLYLDSNLLVSAGYDSTVRLWDLRDPTDKRLFLINCQSINSLMGYHLTVCCRGRTRTTRPCTACSGTRTTLCSAAQRDTESCICGTCARRPACRCFTSVRGGMWRTVLCIRWRTHKV